jgi:hypothetical protein
MFYNPPGYVSGCVGNIPLPFWADYFAPSSLHGFPDVLSWAKPKNSDYIRLMDNEINLFAL